MPALPVLGGTLNRTRTSRMVASPSQQTITSSFATNTSTFNSPSKEITMTSVTLGENSIM